MTTCWQQTTTQGEGVVSFTGDTCFCFCLLSGRFEVLPYVMSHLSVTDKCQIVPG
jgi:hypothetical protein